jgi:hypothetical protein
MDIFEYTDTECDACFYTSTDYKSFKKLIKETVCYVGKTSSNSKQPCTRGLERYTKGNSIIIKKRRSVAYEIVFDYQDLPEFMAKKLLVSSCSEGHLEAHIRGLDDEEAAQSC